MARTARIYSESGYYHIVARGTNKQILFHEDMDYRVYLKYLHKYSKKYKIKTISYCLMPNHLHILVLDNNNNISNMMHDVQTSYSLFHNAKYKRTGPVFEDRFHGRAINSVNYILNAFRYILQNPQKAGLSSVENYKWSSFAAYNKKSWIDLDIIKNYLPSFDIYCEFLIKPETDYYFEFDKISNNDEAAKQFIENKFHINSCRELNNFEDVVKIKSLKFLRKNGLSISQISRLTGISRKYIQHLSIINN